MEETKKIKTIFGDYKSQNLMQECDILNIKLFKKENRLALELNSKDFVPIKDMWDFEKFLMERFKFKAILMVFHYENKESIPSIEKEWKNIICYMAHKHPLMKPTLLMNSTINVENNIINVKMHIKGADFLRSRKTDQQVEKTIKYLMDKDYKIKIEEDIKEEDLKKLEEQAENLERQAINSKIEEVKSRNNSENQNGNHKENYGEKHGESYAEKSDLQNGAVNPPNPENYIGENPANYYENIPYNTENLEGGFVPEIPQEFQESTREENSGEETNQKYIIGKPSRAKEHLVKIKDINSETGRVTIKGRITDIDIRDTKTGKKMIILEVYDGSGIIVCKAFCSQEEGEKVNDALTNLGDHATKITGKAGLDTYAGDVTIIANTIIATQEIAPLPPEEDLNTPLIYGNSITINEPITQIKNLNVDDGRVALLGQIINSDNRELKNGSVLYSFDLYDGTSTITCKAFLDKKSAKRVMGRMKKAKAVKILGNAGMDKFANELTVMANNIVEVEPPKQNIREDTSEEKRVELHLHTKMSQMDGMTETTDYIKRAMKWGMKAMAITDHGSVQGFPEAHKMLGFDNPDMKILYGMEAYIVPDRISSVSFSKGQDLNDATYCVFDLETTGISLRTEKITEVGIMKVKNGKVIDEFKSFVNPEKPIPQEVVNVTHITDEMVKDADTIEKVLPRVLEFFGDSILVAHNADFDIGFLKHNAKLLGYELNNTYIDTLRLAKDLFPEFKKYKLGKIAEYLNIEVEVAHRALDDVDTTVKVFNVMLDRLREKGVHTLDDIDKKVGGDADFRKLHSYHATILAQNYIGLRNLYKLVSISHLDYFYKHPRILKSIYRKYSEGLIIGSGCEAGELYRALEVGKTDEELEEIAKDYDFLEIQPIGNNMKLVRDGSFANEEGLRNINRKILEIGDSLGKIVVATGDVHFLDPQDEIYRRILRAGQGFKDADEGAPLYFMTTDEMLKEFSYLGEQRAREVVITNSNKIADMCDKISPISPEKCPPHIPGCENTIKEIAYNKAHELYGDPLPEIVQERLDKELNSIIKNGFSVMYIIAQKLVWKSNEDGYIVGSRGSVGSSLVAFMTGITEVNSLAPHYRCPKCKFSDFTDYGVLNGLDLPDKDCPKCGEKMVKDGMDIPFETFLGFNGDKEPDIDLNFSGEYQAKAHRYTEVIFGKGTTFKAGTVGTVADKTAFGYVKNYYEERNIPVASAEVARVATGCTGIKRTTGQHPGGIIVVPKGREIYEFTPVQHPADDPNSDIITTHFDYHSIDQNLLKLDILGHDDPTMIRMLFDITGIDPTKVPLDDKETMSIFQSTKALGVTSEQIHSTVGTYGVPEFGTKFVRGMLVDTKPTTFDELIRISGLSHGTDVWLGNAQTLIDKGIVTLTEAICCRDDIMNYLIRQGLPKNDAFKIMEFVRKGKVSKQPEKWPKMKAELEEYKIADWYIKSCEKIKYMFPKAHAVAYVINAFRIAWFKVHQPKAYYTSYFTIRAEGNFDSNIMCHGKEKVINKMKEIDLAGNAASKKDQDMYTVLELVDEMYERGINFLPIDLYKSDSRKFIAEPEGIRPPFSSIPGLGGVAADSIVKARQEGEFMCIDEIRTRARVGDSVIELLRAEGCLKGMTESNQMSLFV